MRYRVIIGFLLRLNFLVKDFKVFVYSCRSDLTLKAPAGWDIRNEEDIGELSDVLNKQFSLDDLIASVSKDD